MVVGFKNLKINESSSVQDIIMQIENYVNRKWEKLVIKKR